jgi:uncharacterized membrane protein
MMKKRLSMFKTFARTCAAFLLVIALLFTQSNSAMAARSGGGFGGGSFSRSAPRMAPRMAPSGPSYGNYPSRGYGGGYGGGFGFPFMLPFFFGGGGSLVGILVFIAIANFLVSAFRNASSEGVSEQDLTNPPTSINMLQIGLLAQARSLQSDLDRIALASDTNSPSGLATALQETTLTLLRHPQYWVYGSSNGQQTRLLSAESEFNRLTLSERGKFHEETLSNYGMLRQKSLTPELSAGSNNSTQLAQAPGEYIVVTLIVASQGKLVLPAIQSAEDVQKALGQIGSQGSEDLIAMRVLWTPQADGDTLSAEDVVEAYPNLRRL